MTNLSASEIAKIAHLARLKVTPAESELYSTQISEIISYFDILKEVTVDQDLPDIFTGEQGQADTVISTPATPLLDCSGHHEQNRITVHKVW